MFVYYLRDVCDAPAAAPSSDAPCSHQRASAISDIIPAIMAPPIQTAAALLQNWLSRDGANPKTQTKVGRTASGRNAREVNGALLIPL